MAELALETIMRTSEADSPSASGRKFIFDHIQKTGGTAFKIVLEQIFGVQNISPAVSGRSELWAEQRYSDYTVINGHFHSPIPITGGRRERARITMLRDPIDRAVSEYYYYRNDVARVEWNKLAVLAKDHDLYGYVKLLEANRDAAISNLYARRFASQLSRQLWSEKKILALAKAALDRYDFVGIQEQFVDSVDMFCCQFGLPPVTDTPRINTTSSREKLENLDRRTREQLVRMNRLDIELYNYALARFQKEKRRIFHRGAGRGTIKTSLHEIRDWAESREASKKSSESFGTRTVEIVDSRIVGVVSGSNVLRPGEQVEVHLALMAHGDVPDLTVGFEISDELGEIVFGTNTFLHGKALSVSSGRRYEIVFAFPANLKHGRYSVGAALHTGSTHEDCCFHWCDTLCTFDVVDSAAADFVGYCRLVPEIRWSDD
jgi:hypothetical protein